MNDLDDPDGPIDDLDDLSDFEGAIAILAMNSVFSALTCFPLVRLAEKTFGARNAVWTGCPKSFARASISPP